MFRLVIELPFKILLVHRRLFAVEEIAERYRAEHYPGFPGIEVWSLHSIDAYRGRIIPFPHGGQHKSNVPGLVESPHQT